MQVDENDRVDAGGRLRAGVGAGGRQATAVAETGILLQPLSPFSGRFNVDDEEVPAK